MQASYPEYFDFKSTEITRLADKNKYFYFVSKSLKSYIPTKLNGKIELEVD